MATIEKVATYEAPGQPGSPVALKPRYDNFVGGHWVPPVHGEYVENLTPATGEPFTEVPKSTPENVRREVSDMMDILNKDPELRKKMIDGGFEVIDVPYDKVPAFMKARIADYMGTAKMMGLVK